MISDYFITIVRILIKIGTNLGFCPYRYDSDQHNFRIHIQSWFRTASVWAGFLCYTFLILPTHFIQSYKEKNYDQISYVVVFFLGALCSDFLIGMQVIKPLPFCQGLNAVWRLLETLPEMYVEEYDVRQDKRKMTCFHFLISFAVVSTVTITIVTVMHFFYFPDSSPYITYNIPPHLMFLPVRMTSCVMVTFSMIGVCSSFAQFLVYAIAYFMFVMPIFRNEMKMGMSQYKMKDKFREPFNLLVNWRSIEIFVVNVTDNEFGFILLPLQVAVTLLILFCNVTLVYQWRWLDTKVIVLLLLYLLMATVGWAVFLQHAGKQYQLSVKVLKTWRPDVWNNNDRKLMTRVKRACRPIWVGDGTRYVIKPGTVLNFLRGLSKNTCRALITYGKVYGHT